MLLQESNSVYAANSNALQQKKFKYLEVVFTSDKR